MLTTLQFYLGMLVLFEFIGKYINAIKTVMIVGHNPCIKETMAIIWKKPVEKFPTCAAAVFSLQNGWGKTATPVGNLEKFVKPRDLK